MTGHDSATPPATTTISGMNPLELNSASAELRSLLCLLYDTASSQEAIKSELDRIFLLNPSWLKEFVVPYSGMNLIFYVAQRLGRITQPSEAVLAEICELFKLFIEEYGAIPNCLDGVMRQNIMFYAAKAGSLACCQELARLGVSANLPDVHNQTALYYAAREGHYEVVEWLVKEGGCKINHCDRNGQTALFYSAREDMLECVTRMVGELGADPLLRDIYKKRARAYLKAPTQKRTFDFLTEVERVRDPSSVSSHRKLFLVRDEPLGAAAMTLRQHKPFNPYHEEEVVAPSPAPAPPKRQRSSMSGASTPSAGPQPKPPKVERMTPAPSPPLKPERVQSSPVMAPATGRSKFRIKAPLGNGGLETFEKSFPDIALWVSSSPSAGAAPSPSGSTPPKAITRPPRTPVAGLTPPWVSVVSLLLRGPLWRYGPATIFHKPLLQLPNNLGPKYAPVPGEPEKKLTIDLSLIRKKLEKGKYLRLKEIDRDIRSMFEQAYSLSGGVETDLGTLTRATEVYYEQQLAGSGLAGVLRSESDDAPRISEDNIFRSSNDVMIQ